MTEAGAIQEKVPVWDPLIRASHWLLLAAVATALITRGEPESIHQAAGYVVAGYVVLRLFWGFAGPAHARFASFVTGPGAALRYLADLVRGRAKRHLGHSPAGAWMTLALLAALSGSAATGLAMENHVAVPAIMAPVVAGEASEAGEEGASDSSGDEESPWEELHEAFANLVLALVVLHIGGVALASAMHRENLARAMVDGRKRALAHGDGDPSPEA
jgi:cytochrome b